MCRKAKTVFEINWNRNASQKICVLRNVLSHWALKSFWLRKCIGRFKCPSAAIHTNNDLCRIQIFLCWILCVAWKRWCWIFYPFIFPWTLDRWMAEAMIRVVLPKVAFRSSFTCTFLPLAAHEMHNNRPSAYWNRNLLKRKRNSARVGKKE